MESLNCPFIVVEEWTDDSITSRIHISISSFQTTSEIQSHGSGGAGETVCYEPPVQSDGSTQSQLQS